MKKFLLLGIVGVVILGVYFSNKKVEPTPLQKEKEAQSTRENTQSVVLDVVGIPIRVRWTEVDPAKLELYSNLKDKKASQAARDEKSCEVLVNGGFYSKENRHLGLFIASSGLVSSAIESSLFNGFLSIDSSGATISTTEPEHVRLATQTGPIILYQGKSRILAIKNDEPARRMVAATTKDGKLVFLMIHRESSEFQGPYMEQLPTIIELFNKETGLGITSAVNLDGGNASAFLTSYINLSERTQIGSYFCAK